MLILSKKMQLISFVFSLNGNTAFTFPKNILIAIILL
jgi:hypothetical protein